MMQIREHLNAIAFVLDEKHDLDAQMGWPVVDGLSEGSATQGARDSDGAYQLPLSDADSPVNLDDAPAPFERPVFALADTTTFS
ncbi:hypothetical protein EW146_g1274 [Bondarzewia mesenterica]|uniref:Uncharacterized protein n=1 Tax=Bondarzewia mesenterica TaxID=1095465 RepID=A0A4V3XG47_9AGAM|nr:hypothetical protein EW146_g1274 [Bondarzewia mesenterica]